MNPGFEWDTAKASANLRKHGVSFEIEGGEQRWQTLGMADGVLLLLVAHTVADLDDGEVIRIISARMATRKERHDYEQKNS